MYTNVSNKLKKAIKSNTITTIAKLTFKDFFEDEQPTKKVEDVNTDKVSEVDISTISSFLVSGKDLILQQNNLTDSDLVIEDCCCANGALIGTAILKETELEIYNPNEYDFFNKVFSLEIGVLIEDRYEYVPYGDFIVTDYQDLKSSHKYKIVANDYMYRLNKLFNENETFNPTFPISLFDFYSELMQSYGIEVEQQDLPNKTFMINAMPNFDGYTGRTVLMRIAELFGSFVKINRNNKCQMYLKTETTEKIMKTQMNDYLEIDNKFGPINVVTVGSGNIEGENVTLRDDTSIEKNGKTTYRMNDNPFIYTEALREQVIRPLFNRLNGFEYIPVSFKYKALMYLDCGDTVQIENMDGSMVETIIFNQVIKVPRTRQSTIETPLINSEEQKLEYISQTKQKQTRTEIIVDKMNNKITAVVEEVDENTEKVSQMEQTVNGFDARISKNTTDIENIGTSASDKAVKAAIEAMEKQLDVDLKDYPTKIEVTTEINAKAGEIETTLKGIVETELEDYSTTATMQNYVSQTIGSYEQTISQTYATKSALNGLSQTVSSNTSSISQNATAIKLKLDSSDFNSAAVISLINNKGTSVAKISADCINLSGYVTIDNDYATKSDLYSGTTVINGGCIATGKISADRIDTQRLVIGRGISSSMIGATTPSDLIGVCPSPSGITNNLIAYFNLYNPAMIGAARKAFNMGFWDDGSMYVRHIYTESGANSEDYMAFVKTPLATTPIDAINYLIGHTSSGSRGINVNTYAEAFDIYAATSDIHLKENIKLADLEALKTINDIELISFDWKSDGKHQDLGFSAQQLQQLNEDFVSAVKQPEGAEYDEILQVRDFNMLPYVVKAIQELNQKIEKLENKIGG